MNRFHVVRGAEGHEKLLSKKDEVKMSFFFFDSLQGTIRFTFLPSWIVWNSFELGGILLQFKYGTDTRVQSALCANKVFFQYYLNSLVFN